MPGLSAREPRIKNSGGGGSKGVKQELTFRCKPRGKLTVISRTSVKSESNIYLL